MSRGMTLAEVKAGDGDRKKKNRFNLDKVKILSDFEGQQQCAERGQTTPITSL